MGVKSEEYKSSTLGGMFDCVYTCGPDVSITYYLVC